MEIVDAKYEKANLAQVVHDMCSHLSDSQQAKILDLLEKYEELFDGTLGNFHTVHVGFKLKIIQARESVR